MFKFILLDLFRLFSGDRIAQSGALQITLANLSLDHYPYHEYGSSKTHWVKYSEMLSSNREEWASRIRQEWNEELNAAKNNAPSDEVCKYPLTLRKKV